MVLLAVGGFFFALSLIFVALLGIKKPNQEEIKPTPTLAPIGRPSIQEGKSINSLQKVEIGVTTDEELSKIPGIDVKESPSGGKIYTLPSVIKSRPQQIKTSSGVAVSERLVLPSYLSEPGFETLSSLTKLLGKPGTILTGSLVYGNYAKRYLYLSRGVAATVNPYTDEVFEILHFKPMSLGEFKKQFPEDSVEAQPANEIH